MHLSSYILIGGRSSRMGRDKALLEFEGKTFAQRAVDTVSTAFPDNKVSLVTRDADQFPADVLPAGVPVIYDIYKDRGAYGALHAALDNAQSEWIFVLACDLPLVTVDFLKSVAELINGVFDAIVSVSPDGQVQPLCAFYRVDKCLKTVEEIVGSEGKLPPLLEIFERVNKRFVVAETEELLVNVNSEDDLRDLPRSTQS